MNLANSITITRMVLIIPFILILVSDLPYKSYIACALFFILCLSDYIDGYVARKKDQATSIGAMLDPLADKLLVSAALIFLIGKGVDAWMAYVIIAREFLITGLRSFSHAVHKGDGMPARLSGKVKTVIQMLAIGAVILSLPYAYYLMLAATIITIYSGLEYIWMQRKILSQTL